MRKRFEVSQVSHGTMLAHMLPEGLEVSEVSHGTQLPISHSSHV